MSKSFPAHTETAAYLLARDRLQLVENQIQALRGSDLPIVREIAGYLHVNGGKRLRPALVLLCARLLRYEGRLDIDLGVIVEFIHTATLVHDDIIDRATTRRGGEPVNRLWGNQLAVLLGDFLYARSLAMSVALGNLRIVEVLTNATSRLVEGEMLDVIHNGDTGLDLDGYLDVVDRKTASLFVGCARSAAVLSDATSDQEEALECYGRNLGIAFQLIDDLLDYTASPSQLGKQPGTDLREGKVTLPLIHLLEHGDAKTRECALARLGKADAAMDGFEALVQAMRACGSIEATSMAASEFAREARDALLELPDNEARDALAELPDYIIGRQR